MAKLILVRHSETIFNKEKVFSGLLDVPLSAEGIEQAKILGNILKDEMIDWVFVSSLIRAKETAAIVLQEYYNCNKNKIPLFINSTREIDLDKYIPVQADMRLNERSYGICEGKKKEIILEQYGEKNVFNWRRGWDSAPPGGETLKEIYQRITYMLEDDVKPKLEFGNNVLVVCHQNSLRAFKIIIENIKESDVKSIEFNNSECVQYNFNRGRFSKLH